MKQSILGTSAELYYKKLVIQILLCAGAAVTAIGLNILLVRLRTPENHNLFLFLNIVTDILCGWFLLFFLTTRIIPRLHLYRLTQRQFTKLYAAVETICAETVRYMNLDCRKITADGHIFFLPENTIHLEPGGCYTFYLVCNTVVEVEQ